MASPKFVEGCNTLTSSIYQGVGEESRGNFLVSSFSLGVVLALLEEGARGETSEEILKVLGFSATTKPVLKEGIQALHGESVFTQANKEAGTGGEKEGAKEAKEGPCFYSANKMYVAPSLTIDDKFKATVESAFHAEIENLDFSDSNAAVKIINDWVGEKTREKITDLMDASALNQSTKSVVVNALYFKARWAKTFKKFATRKAPFHCGPTESGAAPVESGAAPEVDMMHMDESALYYDCPQFNAQFLTLPFAGVPAGHDVSMSFILPHQGETLARLEAQLPTVFTKLNPQLNESLKKTFIKIAIPKFRMEFSKDLKQLLHNKGIKKAFTDQADFSGIDGQGNLMVDKIAQKTFIEVDETGVEAAAATFATMAPCCAFLPPSLEFKADRPFMFCVSVDNIPIFVGRYVKPPAS